MLPWVTFRPGGIGGTVETRLHSNLEIFCHFQNCKAKVCRTNGSKVNGNYWLDSWGPLFGPPDPILKFTPFLGWKESYERITITIKVTMSVILSFKFYKIIKIDIKLWSFWNCKYSWNFFIRNAINLEYLKGICNTFDSNFLQFQRINIGIYVTIKFSNKSITL